MSGALVKLQYLVETNPNMVAGVQVDTAVYVGTGSAAAGMPVLVVGRNPPVYILEGTQTAAVVRVCMSNENAYHGAKQIIRIGTGAATTSIVSVVTGSQAGPVVNTITSGVGREATIVFDGVAMTWK